MDKLGYSMFFIGGILVGLSIGAYMGGRAIDDTAVKLEAVAIKHECAHYDAQTGAFTWNKEVGR